MLLRASHHEPLWCSAPVQGWLARGRQQAGSRWSSMVGAVGAGSRGQLEQLNWQSEHCILQGEKWKHWGGQQGLAEHGPRALGGGSALSMQQGQADPAPPPQLLHPSHLCNLFLGLSPVAGRVHAAGPSRLSCAHNVPGSTGGTPGQNASAGAAFLQESWQHQHAADPVLTPALLCPVQTQETMEGCSWGHRARREGSQLQRILKSSKSRYTHRRAETHRGWQTSALGLELHEVPVGPQCQGPLLGHPQVPWLHQQCLRHCGQWRLAQGGGR